MGEGVMRKMRVDALETRLPRTPADHKVDRAVGHRPLPANSERGLGRVAVFSADNAGLNTQGSVLKLDVRIVSAGIGQVAHPLDGRALRHQAT